MNDAGPEPDAGYKTAGMTRPGRFVSQQILERNQGSGAQVTSEPVEFPFREDRVVNKRIPRSYGPPIERRAIYIDARFPSLSGTPDASYWPALPTPGWEQTDQDEAEGSTWDSGHVRRLDGEQRRMQGTRRG